MADLAYQVTGFAYQGSGLFAYQGSVDGVSTDAIRNFSLRRWRDWKRDEEEIEAGNLPEELRAEAELAVRQAEQASAALAAGKIESSLALLRAMEARQAYERAYLDAYASAYVAQIVADHWRADMARARRRRAAALLLLH